MACSSHSDGVHVWDLDLQLEGDYRRFRPQPRACLPKPFFRAKKRKHHEALTPRGRMTRPGDSTLRVHGDPRKSIGIRSTVEVERRGFVLPQASAWVQGDVFLGDVPPPIASRFAAVVMDPPWESKSRGVRYASCRPIQLKEIPLAQLRPSRA
eukprot:g6683.t1